MTCLDLTLLIRPVQSLVCQSSLNRSRQISLPVVADKNLAASSQIQKQRECGQCHTDVFLSEDMEAFLKTGKVGASSGGSTSKPGAKPKGEKKQGPVSFCGNFYKYSCWLILGLTLTEVSQQKGKYQ